MIDSKMPLVLEMSDHMIQRNPTLDYTTPDLIKLIVSDLGAMTPSVSIAVGPRRSEDDWLMVSFSIGGVGCAVRDLRWRVVQLSQHLQLCLIAAAWDRSFCTSSRVSTTLSSPRSLCNRRLHIHSTVAVYSTGIENDRANESP